MGDLAKIVLVTIVLPVAAQVAQQIAEQWLEDHQRRKKKRWVIRLG
jgi:hypothetical protein